jgi:hypothetical protein
MRRPLLQAAAALTLGLVSSGAFAAEPSAADKETSRALYGQGMAALDAHDYAAAERACAGVFKLVNAPTGAVCWAKALEGLGKLVEARDAYLSAAHYPVRPDEPSVFTSARDDGKAGADRVEKRIATIVLDVSGAKDGSPLQVTIDDVVITSELARLPRRVNPGHHIVLVSSPGYRAARVEVAAEEGQEARVSVPLLPGEVGDSGAKPAPPTSSRVPAFVAFGAGGAGLIVGSIFGAMALSDASGLKSQPGCPSSCPPSAQPQIDTLHGHQWASDIGLGVGVVGLAIGAALFLTSHAPEGPPTTSLRLDAGPGVVVLRGGF